MSETANDIKKQQLNRIYEQTEPATRYTEIIMLREFMQALQIEAAITELERSNNPTQTKGGEQDD